MSPTPRTDRWLPTIDFDFQLDFNLKEAIDQAAATATTVDSGEGTELAVTPTGLTWTCASAAALVKNADSAAELYWRDEDGKVTLIAHVWGSLWQAWPVDGHRQLNLEVSTGDFAKAERASGGRFAFATHERYLARLFFIPRASGTSGKRVGDGDVNSQNQLAASERAARVAGSTSSPLPHNVRLVFPYHPTLEIWCSTHLLQSSSSYFRSLFSSSSNFLESQAHTQADHSPVSCDMISHEADSDDSDDEADDLYEAHWVNPPNPPPDFLYHQVKSSHAYTTYRAVLAYLQTGYLHFAPITSTFSSSAPSASTTDVPPKTEYLAKWIVEHPDLPLPSSPKSIYRLAHFLDLSSLASLALANYKTQFSPSNLSAELFSSFANTFDEVRAVLVQLAVQHWGEIKVSREFGEMLEGMRRNEVMYGAAVADLMPVMMKG